MDQGSRNSSKSENFFTDDSEDFFTKLNSSSDDLSESDESFFSSSSSTIEESIHYKHIPSRKLRKSKAKSHQNCIQVDLADLDASLQLLNKNLDTNPNRIPKSDLVYTAYENVKLFVSMFYGREEYPKIMEIMNTFAKPNKIVPDTIGAFLFGCSQTSYGDIPNKFCSPLCLHAVLPNEPTGSSGFCPYQVWTMDSTSLEPISQNSSDSAYIFVSGDAAPKFTPKQITLLRSLGLKQAQVLRTQDSKHVTVIPLSELENLPIITPADSIKPAILQANNTSTVNSSRLLAIIIILLLIALAVWLIFKYVIPRR